MNDFTAIMPFLFGAFVGFCANIFFFRKHQTKAIRDAAVAQERENLLQDMQKNILAERDCRIRLSEEKAALQALLDSEKQNVQKIQEKFSEEFSLLSQKICKENSKEFSEEAKGKIEELLFPLKQKIDLFQTNIQEINKAGTVERLTLKNTIEHIIDSNKTLAEETHRLAKTLKGDVKKQGAWGELILQKVLEASGLREEEEYTLQGLGLGLQNADGRRLQPDAVIHLPQNKQVIIDSKMSYTHYDDYFNAATEAEKEESLKKLLASIREHIRGLSEKNYALANGVDSPHFVLLFVPIEAIFSLFLQADPHLFEEAWKKSIVLVSPTNLLAVLRTIESVWKIERQNRNTQKIAEEGAQLYDKFVDFLKDMDNIGKHIKNSQESFDKALNKLSTGNGNMIKKTEDLKRLGLKTKKQISEEYLDFQKL